MKSATVRPKGDTQAQRPYIIGLIVSVVLTSLIFFLVSQYVTAAAGTLPRGVLRIGIGLTAIVQAVVQLICFLHLGQERKPRWKVLVLGFMLGVVIIIVFGSLWIMDNLNYRMMQMSPEQTKTYMRTEEGL